MGIVALDDNKYKESSKRSFTTARRIIESGGIQSSEYDISMVEMAPGESIFTVRVKCTSTAANLQTPPLYMTHGFGGSSLFYYDLLKDLR